MWFCKGCAERLISCRRCKNEYITVERPDECGWAEIDREMGEGLCPDCVEQMERFYDELKRSDELRRKLARRSR